MASLPNLSGLSLRVSAGPEAPPQPGAPNPEPPVALLTGDEWLLVFEQATASDDPCAAVKNLCQTNRELAALCRQVGEGGVFDLLNKRLGWYAKYTFDYALIEPRRDAIVRDGNYDSFQEMATALRIDHRATNAKEWFALVCEQLAQIRNSPVHKLYLGVYRNLESLTQGRARQSSEGEEAAARARGDPTSIPGYTLNGYAAAEAYEHVRRNLDKTWWWLVDKQRADYEALEQKLIRAAKFLRAANHIRAPWPDVQRFLQDLSMWINPFGGQHDGRPQMPNEMRRQYEIVGQRLQSHTQRLEELVSMPRSYPANNIEVGLRDYNTATPFGYANPKWLFGGRRSQVAMDAIYDDVLKLRDDFLEYVARSWSPDDERPSSIPGSRLTLYKWYHEFGMVSGAISKLMEWIFVNRRLVDLYESGEPPPWPYNPRWEPLKLVGRPPPAEVYPDYNELGGYEEWKKNVVGRFVVAEKETYLPIVDRIYDALVKRYKPMIESLFPPPYLDELDTPEDNAYLDDMLEDLFFYAAKFTVATQHHSKEDGEFWDRPFRWLTQELQRSVNGWISDIASKIIGMLSELGHIFQTGADLVRIVENDPFRPVDDEGAHRRSVSDEEVALWRLVTLAPGRLAAYWVRWVWLQTLNRLLTRLEASDGYFNPGYKSRSNFDDVVRKHSYILYESTGTGLFQRPGIEQPKAYEHLYADPFTGSIEQKARDARDEGIDFKDYRRDREYDDLVPSHHSPAHYRQWWKDYVDTVRDIYGQGFDKVHPYSGETAAEVRKVMWQKRQLMVLPDERQRRERIQAAKEEKEALAAAEQAARQRRRPYQLVAHGAWSLRRPSNVADADRMASIVKTMSIWMSQLARLTSEEEAQRWRATCEDLWEPPQGKVYRVKESEPYTKAWQSNLRSGDWAINKEGWDERLALLNKPPGGEAGPSGEAPGGSQ